MASKSGSLLGFLANSAQKNSGKPGTLPGHSKARFEKKRAQRRRQRRQHACTRVTHGIGGFAYKHIPVKLADKWRDVVLKTARKPIRRKIT